MKPVVQSLKTTISKIRIRTPLIITLSAEKKEVFTWKQIRGPLSVTFASLGGMILTQLFWFYNIPSSFTIRTKDVLSTIVMTMEMATSENFYIKSSYRIVGVLVGICIGMIYALIEQVIQRYLGIEKLGKGSDNEWIILIYRILILGPTIFIICILMKLKPTYERAFNILAINIPAAMLAADIYESLGMFSAVGIAVVLAVLSIFLFEKFTTESYLMDTNRVCIHGVLSVVQLALTGDPADAEKFTKHSDSVHKNISAAESAQKTYTQWRSYTCRTVDHDFKKLVDPTRPLYYQAYSLYWGNVSAFHAETYKANMLFCDTREKYDALFRGSIEDHVRLIEDIKVNLGKLYTQRNLTRDEMSALFDSIVVSGLLNGSVRIQESLKRSYLLNRKTCFSTYGQRWNMLDFLRQLSMITLAFVDYMRGMVTIFQDGDDETRLIQLLNEVADALDKLRKESESGSMIYSQYKGNDGDSSQSPSVTVDTRPSNISIQFEVPSAIDTVAYTEQSHERNPLLPRGNTYGGL